VASAGNTHWMQNAGDNTTMGPDGKLLDGPWVGAGKKTVFSSHLYIKMIILPRQALDKHRKNSKKEAFSLRS
jgi:hypothetical protein